MSHDKRLGDLTEDDLRRILSEVGRPPGWVQPPPDSGWTAQADGTYLNRSYDRLYYDPDKPTNSGREKHRCRMDLLPQKLCKRRRSSDY
jgi:hypothetical protein